MFVDISVQSSYTQSGLNNKFIAQINPFRYRSYYYDTETNLYYLNSRYYDPEIGRFINADDIAVQDLTNDIINGLNLYAYCLNNPVMDYDSDGQLPNWLKWLITGIVAAVTIVSVVAITIATAGIATAIGGALGGGIAATIFGGAVGGAVTGALTGFVMGAGINIINQGLSQGYENINWRDVGIESLISAGTGAVSGALFGSLGKALGLIGKTGWAQRNIPNLKNSKAAFMFGSKSGSFTFARFGKGNGFFRFEASLVHGLHIHMGLTRTALTIPRTNLLTIIWNSITILSSYFARND